MVFTSSAWASNHPIHRQNFSLLINVLMNNSLFLLTLILLGGFVPPLFAQNEPSTTEAPRQFAITGNAPVISFGGLQGETPDGLFFTNLMVGQAFAGHVEGTNLPNARPGLTGFWSQLLRTPNPPVLETTRGDFNDKVIVRWFNDPLSPAVNPTGTAPFFTLSREGTQITNIRTGPQTDEVQEFVDTQGLPGMFYNYSMIGFNSFGRSAPAENLGFRSATGLVQGVIRTPTFAGQAGRPVPDVTVSAIPIESVNTNSSPYVGTSVRLDGTASYLQTTKFMQFPVNRTFTLESYVLLNRANRINPIFSGTSTVPTSRINLFVNDDNKLVFQVGTHQVIAETNMPPSGEWVHVAAVSSPEKLQVFVNQILAGELAVSGSLPDIVPQLLQIGRMGVNFYHGYLDEMKVWSSARTQEELALFAGVTASQRDPNLLGYWNFNENTGNLAIDWSRNGHELRLLDGAQWINQPAPVLVAGITDKNGRYVVEGITYNYNAGSQYQIQPFKAFHNFIDPILKKYF